MFSSGSPFLSRPVTESEALQIFRDTGALLEGHFILRSGLRSRQYFQCALALQHMPTVEKLGAALSDKVRALKPVTVIAPAMGGLVIGQEVARQLGERGAELLDGRHVLEREGALEILPAAQTAAQNEMPLEQGARVAKNLQCFGFSHRPG